MRQYKILISLILTIFLLSGCGTRAATADVSSLTSLDSTESAAYSFPAASERSETAPSTHVTVPAAETTTSISESTSTSPSAKTTATTTAEQTKTGSPSTASSTSASTTAPVSVTDPPIITTATTTGTTTETTAAQITSMPQEYLQAVCDGLNYKRQNNGDWSTDVIVVLDADLCARAKDHAIAMANAGDIFHSDYAKAGHPESVTMYASSDGYLEGVAAGVHADNLLLPETVRLGVGAVKTPDGTIYLSVLGDR